MTKAQPSMTLRSQNCIQTPTNHRRYSGDGRVVAVANLVCNERERERKRGVDE